MAIGIMLAVFALMVYLGAPVAITMFGASIAYILVNPDLTLANVATKVIGGVGGQELITLPLFILASDIMNSAGITKRLFNLPLAFIGHLRGGLAHVNVVANMIFAGMSGSAMADAAGLGKIEMKMMTEEGYDKSFSAGIIGAASTIGPIIPPSTTMIVFAVAAQVSVGRLFVGGMVPGVVMGLLLMLYVAIVARRNKLPIRPKTDARSKWIALRQAFFPLLTPFIIIVGIVTGVMTSTEAGAVAVIYALILDTAYNGFSWRRLISTIDSSLVTIAQICFIVLAASLFGYVITIAQLPNAIASFLFNSGAHKWLILLLINLILLFLGCFLSINATILIMTPVLVVIAQMYAISLVQLGVVVTLNLTIGLLTPPVGWVLYIMSGISGLSFKEMVRSVLPMLIPLIISLLLITYVDQIVLWLPNLLMGRG